jgi:hypothetical protein
VGGGRSTSAGEKRIWHEFVQLVWHSAQVRYEWNVNQHMATDSFTNLCLMLQRTWSYKFRNPYRNAAVSRTAEGTDIGYFWLSQLLTMSRIDFDVLYAIKCNRTLGPDYWSRRMMAFIPKRVTTSQSVKWNYSFATVDFRLTTGRGKVRPVTCHRRHRREI